MHRITKCSKYNCNKRANSGYCHHMCYYCDIGVEDETRYCEYHNERRKNTKEKHKNKWTKYIWWLYV